MLNKVMESSLKSHFTDWTETDWKNFFTFTNQKKIVAGKNIFKKDTVASQIFFLISGIVDITSADGETIAEFIKGEIFGQFEFMTSEKYNATATTATDCEVLVFPKEGSTLVEFEETYPEVYAKLIRSFLIFVSRRTRAATGMLKENSPVTQQLKKQLYSDKLTSAYNKTFLQENLKELFKNETSMIIFKPDNFKAVNDIFGHKVGDAVLVSMGKLLNDKFGKESNVIRYEGNTFIIITAKQKKEEAKKFSEKIKITLDSLNFSDAFEEQTDRDFKLTFSLVVVIYPDDGTDILELINSCNKLINDARKVGGNKIIFLSEAKND